MKKIPYLLLLLSMLTLVACDDSTSSIGNDVMPDIDRVSAIDSIYYVNSQTVKADAVLANTSSCYLGSIVDPVLNIKTTSGFLAQYHCDNKKFPSKDGKLYLPNGQVEADSCDLRVYISSFVGDSLATMKLRVQELGFDKILEEGNDYYSNLDPEEYIKQGGIDKTISYAVKDLTLSDSLNNGLKYLRQVKIKLPADYGTKVMNAYFEHPEYFENSYSFIHNVCPGFSFKCVGGTGSLIKTSTLALNIYFRYHDTTTAGNDTIVDGQVIFGGTEEVLQANFVKNDGGVQASTELATIDATDGCTMIKSPAGYFTELDLPVDHLIEGTAGEHYNDSINAAKIIVHYQQMNNEDYDNLFPAPQQLFLVRTDSVKTFFEKSQLPDSETNYLSSSSSATANYYTFSNIAPLLSHIKAERDRNSGVTSRDTYAERQAKYRVWEQAHPNWNKVMLLPVDATYTQSTSTYGTSTSVLRSVKSQLGLSSAKIEGGPEKLADGTTNPNRLQLQVTYVRYHK